MKNTLSFYIVFQVLQVTHKHLRDKPPDPISCCFMLAFTSADIIFYKLLELHSSLSVKKIFVTNFPFLRDSLKDLHSPKSQNLLSVTKVFRQCSLIVLFFRTRASMVIPTKWCKTFETCTWTISEFDKNSPICYNNDIRRFDNPKNFSW